MKLIFTFLFAALACLANGQVLTWSPQFIQESSTPVIITMDATKGNQALKDYLPTNVYVHIGAITTASTSSSDWRYSKFQWATTPPEAKATPATTNKWTYTISGGLRSYFGITNPAEKILYIAILFRSGDGNRVQRNADGSDMYILVYEAGLNVRFTNPPSEPKYAPVPEQLNKSVGDALPVSAAASQNADLKLYLNGTEIGTTAINSTTISHTATITTAGQQLLVAEAVSAGTTRYDTIKFFVSAPVTIAPLPAGVKDGVNYNPGNTSVTLVLFAPNKNRVSVIGHFNDWTETVTHQMNRTPDGQRYWITISGLTPQVEYGYQYLIDGTLKLADYTTEKVLDPSNDQFISAANYPNLKPYPTGKTTGIVSVFQTAKPVYNWQVTNFVKPDKRNLMIYELLVRDFLASNNWQTLKDTISYFKRLGINSIEIMPFNEFEGNNSWGYNSDFFLAPDKVYGTETALKQFIDECHKQGIAVIMDLVINHSYGPSPMALMYWDAMNNRPAANNPWYNPVQPHAFGFGNDFNHESTATKEFFNRVLQHWIVKYKIDGYRLDFTKGLTQKTSTSDAAFSAYDASRIAILKSYADNVRMADPNAYIILEHFADNTEEKELSEYGMLLWANVWNQYQEASMGYVSNSNFGGGIHTSRNWTNPHLVSFMESHDEERITYKNIKYGNASGSYSIKDTATALKRMELNAAFLLTIPGPKMIFQFGEVGYDYSRCYLATNGEGGDCNTKLDPKPIRWNYLQNQNRQQVFNVYSKLLKLRNVPDYLPTWVSSNINQNLAGSFKSLQVSTDALKVVVIGNFDVVPVIGSVTFPNAGTWYNYLQGGTRNATGSSESITLQPGEYYVFLDRDPTAQINALPLKLISFAGTRGQGNIALKWITTNEVNVNHFELQRSINGIDFKTVNKTQATNRPLQQYYSFNDIDAIAINAAKNIYYRLKIVDIDGSYTYSSIATINPVVNSSKFTLYPNPVKGSHVYVNYKSTSTSVNIKIEDITGRIYTNYKVNMSNYSNGILPVDVRLLTNGAYLLKIENNNNTQVKQFIVNH